MNCEREFTSEFVINNLPEEQREHLLLKDVRSGVCKAAGKLDNYEHSSKVFLILSNCRRNLSIKLTKL